MIRALSRLQRDEKGAALLEALVSLPVFIAALAGVVALNGMYSAKLEAKSRARRLAWLQADSGECPAQSCRSGECGQQEDQERKIHATDGPAEEQRRKQGRRPYFNTQGISASGIDRILNCGQPSALNTAPGFKQQPFGLQFCNYVGNGLGCKPRSPGDFSPADFACSMDLAHNHTPVVEPGPFGICAGSIWGTAHFRQFKSSHLNGQLS